MQTSIDQFLKIRKRPATDNVSVLTCRKLFAVSIIQYIKWQCSAIRLINIVISYFYIHGVKLI